MLSPSGDAFPGPLLPVPVTEAEQRTHADISQQLSLGDAEKLFESDFSTYEPLVAPTPTPTATPEPASSIASDDIGLDDRGVAGHLEAAKLLDEESGSQPTLEKSVSEGDVGQILNPTIQQIVETLRSANGPPAFDLNSPNSGSIRRTLVSESTSSATQLSGKESVATDEAWSGTENYVWDMDDAAGVEGESPGWDLVEVHGILTISATAASTFKIEINSVNGVGIATSAEHFDKTAAGSWRILHTTQGIQGFERSKFTLDASAFASVNDLGSGSFLLDISTNSKDLVLRFVPSLPSVTLLNEAVTWKEEGPFSIINNANTLVSPNNPVIGAVQTLVPHPTDAAVAYLGAASGGVWKSTNFNTASPTWTPIGDHLPSLSIGALAVSPVNPGTVFVGTGTFSSAGKGGQSAGVFRSLDDGLTWEEVGSFDGLRITRIVPSSTTAGLVLVSTFDQVSSSASVPGRGGLYRSLDDGERWDRLSGIGTPALPEFDVSDVAEEPGSAGRFYVAISSASVLGAPGVKGVFRADNANAPLVASISWANVTAGLTPDYDNDGVASEAGETVDAASRIRLAVSGLGTKSVYVAIIGPNPSKANSPMLAGVFRSINQGGAWLPLGKFPSATSSDVPQTNPTGQGDKHFAIAADPLSDDRVYIAGAIYSTNPYVATAYRWDSNASTWSPITSDDGSGPGANTSAPHGDVRGLVFSINKNDLSLVSDGGPYRLSNPRADNPAPKWQFIGQGLRVTEIAHSVAYDHNTNSIFAGTQDVGVVRQTAGGQVWDSLTGGDGNNVGVGYDGTTSTRFFMSNNFNGFFLRRFTDPSDADDFSDATTLTLKSISNAANNSGLDNAQQVGGTAATDRGFKGFQNIPFVVNAINQKWLLMGRTMVYVSTDEGNEIRVLTALASNNRDVTALAYGGRESNTDEPGIIYVARGAMISVSSDDGAKFQSVTAPGSGAITSIALDPNDWRSAFAVDRNHIWYVRVEDNGSLTVRDATANLKTITGGFEAVEVWRSGENLYIAAGTHNGVYWTSADDLGLVALGLVDWSRLGEDMPNVSVPDLVYDAVDDILVAGTQGRGAWSLSNISRLLVHDVVLRIETGAGNDIVKLRLKEAAAAPAELEILVDEVLLESVMLSTVRRISIHTGGGNDKLILDSVHGEIVVPGGIEFDGGDQIAAAPGDELDFQGPAASKLEVATEGEIEIRQLGLQKVYARHVETFNDTTSFEDFVSFWRNIWDSITGFFGAIGDALSPDLPVIGDALGSGLNGADFAKKNPIGFPSGGPGAPVPGGSGGDTNSLWRRLFESGSKFRPADLGTLINSASDFQAVLESLDNIPSNVTVDDDPNELILGDLSNPAKPFRRNVAFEVPINLDLLGGLLRIHGNLEMSADFDFMLKMGADARGFYVATDASALPEFTLRNLKVNGSLTASGNFGLLAVTLENATINLASGVGIKIDITEPVDPFGHVSDGKIRLYEFLNNPVSFFNIGLATDALADDLVLQMGIRVAAMEPGGTPLFDFPLATVQLIWPEINDPLKVTVKPVGGPAEILYRLLNFRIDDLYSELKRTINGLGGLSGSAMLGLELPFGSGLDVGASFDFSGAFLDKIFAKLVDIQIVASTGNGNATGKLAQGQLTANAVFALTIDNAPAKTVTVTKASTDTGADKNNTLADLVKDINEALTAAGLAGKAQAFLKGPQIALRLIAGGSLKITGEASNPAFTEIGFTRDDGGMSLPKFPSLQQVVAELKKAIAPFDINPRVDIANKTFALDLSFGYHVIKTTPFQYDSDIGLGDLADVSASGIFTITGDASVALTIGVDLKDATAPKLITSPTLPPPSSGSTTAVATFGINLNDGEYRAGFLLPKKTRASLQELINDLNGLLAGAADFRGTPLRQVIHFTATTSGPGLILEAVNEDLDADGKLDKVNEDTNGNHVLDAAEDLDADGRLDVNEDVLIDDPLFKNNLKLDSWLGKVGSIAIESANNDPIVTELGFNNVIPARSGSWGMFLENVNLGGTLAVAANNLKAKARFAIFEISTSGGTASGALSVTLKLSNPHAADPLHPTRLDLDVLLRHMNDLGSYVTPDTQTSGFVDIQLKNIKVLPDLPTASGNPLIPAGSQLGIFVPDFHDIHFNPDPYDVATNKKGVFVTFPAIGSFGDFRCTTFLDVVAILDSLSDELEGLKAFSFLSEPLPLVNVSVSDVLDFAGDLSRLFKKLSQGDGAAITQLETDIENFLGLSPSKFSITLDDARKSGPAGGSAAVRAVAWFNPSGAKNALLFTAKNTGTEFNQWKIVYDDDGSLPSGTDAADVLADAVKKTLTIHYNATYTKAETVRLKVNSSATSPFTASLDTSAGPVGDGPTNNGSNTITETALKFHLQFGLSYGNTLPLQFSLGEIVNLLPPGHPARALLEGVSQIIQVEGDAKLNVTASATLDLDFGLDLSGGCNLIPFLYDTTAMTLSAAVRATGVNLSAGIGSLKVSVKNGTVTLDKDGDPTTTDSATFAVGFKDNNGDGRHYFRSGEKFFDSDNIGMTLTGAASANLPLFALDSLPIGGATDGPDAGNEPDNWLVFQSGPLDKLFSGDTSLVLVRAPDISSLFDDINACDLIANPDILVDGLDALLGVIQDGLGSKLSRNMPLVGGQFGKAADFIMEFRTGLLAEFRQTLAEGGDPISLAKQAIFNALGTPGLDILAGVDGSPITNVDQVDIQCVGNAVKFNIRLKKAAKLLDTSSNPIDFDIGIPGLGLSVDGNVKIEAGFDLKLKFVVSATDGFYFDTSDPEELRLDFNVTIPGLKAKGQLLFLQLDVSDESDGKSLVGETRESSRFTGYFSVDLKDPVGSGNKLTIGDMTSSAFSFDKFIEAKLGAEANLALDLSLSFGGDTRFPRIVAEFDLKWSWVLGGDGAGSLAFGFHNVSLDIGSFISQFMGPIFKELKEITGPLEPVVDVITAPLPIISDIAGRDYSLLDLAEAFGMITPSTREFIDVLVVVIRLANSTVANDGSILLPLGSFDIEMDKFGNLQRKAGQVDGATVGIGDVGKFIVAPGWVTGSQISPANAGQAVGKENVSGGILSFLDDLEKIGITLPFLSIGEISKLFLGKPISLFEYHLPVLDFQAGFEIAIPIIGPLYVKFGGKIGAYADLTIGYDTFGIQKFFSSEDKNALDIFDGFYIKDVDKDGKDVPELSFFGQLYAAGSIDIVIAEAGVRGGLEVQVDFNLNDPDDDGRVRISEIVANAKKDIRCIFDIHGKFTAFLEAYLIVDLLLFKIDATFRFAEITLLEFDITCPEPKLADYVDASGNELDAADAGGSLRLNIGKYANEREIGDTTDGNENYKVVHVEDTAAGETVDVSFGGIKQTYRGVKKIWGRGGAGNDVINLRTVTSPVDSSKPERGLHGDDGNDKLYAGRGGGRYDGDNGNDIISAEDVADGYDGRGDEFHGGAGSDELTGLEGDDNLYGDDGSDTLFGGAGNDHLWGGTGNDKLYGSLGDDVIEGNEGADTIDGDEGDDIVSGGAGDDTITGGLGADRLVGGDGDDNIDGGLGNDIILGDNGTIVSFLQATGVDGNGNDLLAGGPGTDVLFGAGGRDALYGGTLLVSGKATPGDTDTDTQDFIDGGDQDDIIYADDAHSAALTTFPGANIGNMVWFDSLDAHGIRNNVRDSHEMGVPGIKVELLDSTDAVVGKTTTDTGGLFKFTGLKGGDYKLRYTLPTGLAFVNKDTGSDDEADSDVNTGTGLTETFHLNDAQIDYSRDAGVKGTQPLLVIDNPSITEADTGQQLLVFTVTLTSVSDQIITVAYESVKGTATNIADYSTVDYTLVFRPGETQKSIEVPILGDFMDEPDQTFTVKLYDPWNAELDPAHKEGVGTIVDDDDAPGVSAVDGVQLSLINPVPEATGMTFVVRLSHPSWQPIKIQYLTQQVVDSSGRRVVDAARPILDYSAVVETVPGVMTFASGEVEKTVVIPIFGDALSEYDEQFQLRIQLDPSTPSDAAKVVRPVATARILDDDPRPFVEFFPTITKTVLEGHAGNTPVTLNVHLSAVSGRDVVINWNTSPGTASNAAPTGQLPDYVYKFETVTIKEGSTDSAIEFEVVGDTHLEPDEYFFVNLLSATNGRLNVIAADLNHAVITIKNDESGDPGPWYVEFARKHYEVKESEGSLDITLVRAEGSSEPVAVYWSVGGTATAGSDYTGIWEKGTSGPRGFVRFEVGETAKVFTVPIVDNDAYEGDETIILNLLNPTGGPVRGLNPTTIITIQEDDPLPTLQIFAVNNMGPDLPDGNSEEDPVPPPGDFDPAFLLFDVIAEGKTEVPVKIDWIALNGTAIAPLDFLPSGGTLNFGVFSGTKILQVKVPIIDDGLSEGLESVIGMISNPVNAEIVYFQDTTYIYDNDFSLVSGRVFYDVDNDGFFDADTDWGLPNVTVKLKDFQNEYTVKTEADGSYKANVYLGTLVVTVDESTTPVDSALTTGNNPLIAEVSTTVLKLRDFGFVTPPKKGKPDTSTGNGLAYFNDVVYGGPGSDVLDGGPGNDWLVGGHWLGPAYGCTGKPYSASLKQADFPDGNRIYVDPASIPAPATITGRVWLDNNPADNRRAVAEVGVKDVQVNLFDSEWVLVGITYTDAVGIYKFEKLAACSYQVQFLVPAGYTLATANVGTDDRDSDANGITGLTDPVVVAAGQTLGNVDAGLHPVAPGTAGPWSLQFSHLVYSVRETDGFATITILRTPGSTQPVGTYWTQGVTATSGLDYTGIWENGAAGVPGRRTIGFGVDENELSFIIPIKKDALTETPPEYFKLFLKNPTGGPVYGNLPEAIVLIFDNPCPDDDTIYGQDGDDIILGDFGYFSNAGLAQLLGGVGNDVLVAGTGADTVYGEGGNDRIEGGVGDDTLNGGGENDSYLFDGDKNLGNDLIIEVASPFGGNDTLDLSQTSSRAISLDLGSTLLQQVTTTLSLTLPAGNVIENAIGGDQNDVLSGNSLDNLLSGGFGNDQFEGKGGNDDLRGGPGSDTYYFDADTILGHDRVVESLSLGTFRDQDRVDFSKTTTLALKLDLGQTISQVVNGNLSLTLSSALGIENLYGGTGNDVLIGNKRNNRIRGGEGNDQVDGGPPGDTSNDTLVEERGGGFNLTDTTLTLISAGETDTYADFENVSLVGDDSDNTLDAQTFGGEVRLEGRGGNDTLIGGSGQNFLSGGSGNDSLTGNGLDTIFEERDANFTLTNSQLKVGLSEVDTYFGTIERVELTGGEGDNLLDAAAFTTGTARLDGRGGNDTLIGTNGPDELIGGAGDDSLQGRDGADVYYFDTDSPLSNVGGDLLIESTTGGVDTLDFAGTTSLGITLDLGSALAQTININLKLRLSARDVFENIIGGQNNDRLLGNDLVNQIEGLRGSDTLTGAKGNDVLNGGVGIDQFGKPFVDRVLEERNANMVLTDSSLVFGGGETDSIIEIEAATLIGGVSNNTLNATAFTGSATLDGRGADDVLLGGSGDDVLIGGAGNDSLTGSGGDDTYSFDADNDLGTDTLNELVGGGIDTLDYAGTSTAIVSVSLLLDTAQIAARTPAPGPLTRHTLDLFSGISIENVIGGSLNDVLSGNSLNNRILGGAGNDFLLGLAGDDWMEGGDGDDLYLFDADGPLGFDHIWEEVGTGGNDTLDFVLTSSSVTVNLGRGIKQVVNPNLSLRLIVAHGVESLIGGSGNDFLIGNSLKNRLSGLGGNDGLAGRRGNDTYVFDADFPLGTDTVVEAEDVEGGVDTLDLSTTTSLPTNVDLSHDTPPAQVVNVNLALNLSSGESLENVLGGQFGSVLTGNSLDNLIVGGSGPDVLAGKAGDDILEGKGGNDNLAGQAGNDTYRFDGDAETGTATIVESVNGGIDTLDFSQTTGVGISINLGNALPQQVKPGLFLNLLANDRIENVIGGSGDDVIQGNSLENHLAGGPGNDRYVFDGDLILGSDIILETSGIGGGVDTLDFSQTTGLSIRVDLAQVTRQIVVIDETTLPDATIHLALEIRNPESIESVIGGAKADKIIGNALNNSLTGGPGNDTLIGGDGVDFVTETRDSDFKLSNATLKIGPSESDSLSSMEGAILTGGAASNTLDASGFTLGAVTLDGGLGNDILRGGASAEDRVVAVRDANMVLTNGTLQIGLETDSITGIERATLVGGAGPNSISAAGFTLGPVLLAGGDGADTLRGGSGDDILVGGLGNDVLDGGPAGLDKVFEIRDANFVLLNGSLQIGAETDTLIGIRAAELTGGDGNNHLDATNFGLGSVVLDGGPGDDNLKGGSRNDRLNGGRGNDTLGGGAGGDVYVFGPSWGVDLVVETPAIISDVDEILFTSDSITATLKPGVGSKVVSNIGVNSVSFADDTVEKIVGSSGSDTFIITPSAVMPLQIEGGGGLEDVLNYDTLGGVTAQTATTLTTPGHKPVTFSGIAVVNLVDPSSIP